MPVASGATLMHTSDKCVMTFYIREQFSDSVASQFNAVLALPPYSGHQIHKGGDQPWKTSLCLTMPCGPPVLLADPPWIGESPNLHLGCNTC